MIQKAIVYLGLLSLWMCVPVQAGILSGDGVSVGQTRVQALVEAPPETQAGTSAASTEGVQRRQAVESGDRSGLLPAVSMFAIGGMGILPPAIQLIKRRRS